MARRRIVRYRWGETLEERCWVCYAPGICSIYDSMTGHGRTYCERHLPPLRLRETEDVFFPIGEHVHRLGSKEGEECLSCVSEARETADIGHLNATSPVNPHTGRLGLCPECAVIIRRKLNRARLKDRRTTEILRARLTRS